MGVTRRIGTPLFDRNQDSPSSIALQPLPVATRVVHLAIAGHVVTSIYRDWRPGDSGPNGRCRLCPACEAHDDGCLVSIGARISHEDAPLASRVGTRSQSPTPG